MNPKLMIASALALAIPTAAPALAFAQDWSSGRHPAPFTSQRGYTELRISPPPGGQVYVYEGHRLLGRFNQSGRMMVASGRDYHVVAMQGDTQLWSGDVTASGAPLTLTWSPHERFREQIAPPRYEQAPSTRPYEAPPRWEQAPPAYEPGGYAAPVISSSELRSLLREMDSATDDQGRLDALADATPRYAFAVPQADWILGRFRTDAYRLAALQRLEGSLVDRRDAEILLRRFRSPSARQQAQDILGWY
jgi:hypothetical protein